ncbi:hypothetical protein BCR43DRAFT_540226 [Syncephalastrum racemosum]|uniref:Carrier domain-containing protein n=1 Tax=Syncephalastrum racemosum TaxID=13706 RepID=A0A1X2HLJ6_SYNRA|nr:hypothetical protein BCR43DRAFT_540226 [Syncephalastrum racemosum]
MTVSNAIEQLVFQYSEHYALINVLEKQFARFSDNVFAWYTPPSGDDYKSLTYGQIDHLATNVACQWAKDVKGVDTVGFIADHSINYLIAMLAFMKLRVTFMALSPRNSLAANVNLIQKTGSNFIASTAKYEDMIRSVAAECGNCHIHVIPTFDIDAILSEPRNPQADNILDSKYGPEDIEKIAMVIHSSGSTSFPKPIRLSNRFWFCAIQSVNMQVKTDSPELGPEPTDVILSCLPLFHLFGAYNVFSQAVAGGSSVILDRLPPQPREIITICAKLRVTLMAAPPLVLDQLANYVQDTNEISALQRLKYIVFGGAALKPEVGDYFHSQGINIRNLYGTTEINVFACCKMSDDFKKWSLLRPVDSVQPYCDWEPFDEANGVYHLVVKGNSPFMATGVANRANGDYATNDLFQMDPESPGYWRHVGRQDDTLVMENGEKTNPTPMEHAISSIPLVHQCTVIGEGRQCTAALVELELKEAMKYTPQEMVAQVQAVVNEANSKAPSHSALLPQMVYILPLNQHLVTTDKGTVIRKRSIDRFGDIIEQMYHDFLEGPTTSTSSVDKDVVAGWSIEDTQNFLIDASAQVLQKDHDVIANSVNESLFDFGLNSLLSIQLRNRMSEAFDNVPTNIVFDYPSIAALSSALLSLRGGSIKDDRAALEDRYQETQALLEDYLKRADKDFTIAHKSKNDPDRQHVVLLTGATGSLGSFMLNDMLRSPRVKKVVALVRGKEDQLFDRLIKTFQDRRLDASLLRNSKLEVLPMKLDAPNLGWDAATYNRLKQEVTLVQACAWLLDFNQPISHFDKECIRGLYNLLKFAHREIDPMYVHTISSVSVMTARGTPEIPETYPEMDPHVCMPIGYAMSKYVVEQLFNYLTREKNFPCIVERMGQVCGDSINGAWNTSEQYPLLIVGGGSVMKKMPDIQTDIDWLPVDHAATGIFEIMLSTADKTAAEVTGKVYHIVNPRTVTWSDILKSMKECGMDFEIMAPADWVKELAKNQENPAYKLLGFYENNFTKSFKMPIFKTDVTVQDAPTLAAAPPFDAKLLDKQLCYWKSVGFYQPA